MTAEDLLGHADLAMNQVRRGGKNELCAYDPTMAGVTESRMEVIGELRGALARVELLLHYQPICSLTGRHMVATEALMRWHRPTPGVVFPAS